MNAKTPQQLYRQQWSGVVQKDLRQVLLHELYTRSTRLPSASPVNRSGSPLGSSASDSEASVG